MSTAPTKSLSAFANVTSPAPASSSVEPPTNKAPPCSIAPPLLRATSAPDTSSVPRSSRPVLVAVSWPAVTVPSVSAFASVIVTAPPVMSTAPVKSLPAFASVTSPVPASSSVVPPTRSASPCPRPLVQPSRAGRRLLAGGDRAHRQRILVPYRHGVAGDVHRAREIVACVCQRHVARARIQLGRATDPQRIALSDRAAVAVRHQGAGNIGAAQVQPARTRRRQLPRGDRAQRQRVRVRDRHGATGDVHRAHEVVAGVRQGEDRKSVV